jgi:hypothetical protein
MTNLKENVRTEKCELPKGVHSRFEEKGIGKKMEIVTREDCGKKTTIPQSKGLEGSADATCNHCGGQAV